MHNEIDNNEIKFWEKVSLKEVKELLEKEPNVVNKRLSRDDTPLHLAVYNAQAPEIMEALINAGADMEAKNVFDNTPLHTAAHGHLNALNFLLSRGADIYARNENGVTPLHIAAATSAEAVDVLLKAHADAEAKTVDYETPLHYAASFDNAKAVEKLIKNGANTDARTRFWQETPLHIAANFGCVKALKALLKCGASLSSKNRDNKTPLQLAEDFIHYADNPQKLFEVISVLKAYTAQKKYKSKKSKKPQKEQTLLKTQSLKEQQPPKTTTAENTPPHQAEKEKQSQKTSIISQSIRDRNDRLWG